MTTHTARRARCPQHAVVASVGDGCGGDRGIDYKVPEQHDAVRRFRSAPEDQFAEVSVERDERAVFSQARARTSASERPGAASRIQRTSCPSRRNRRMQSSGRFSLAQRRMVANHTAWANTFSSFIRGWAKAAQARTCSRVS